MKRNIRVYLQDMHDNMLKALEYTTGLDYEGFVLDSKTNYVVIRCLEIIGEAAKNISDQIRNTYRGGRWRECAIRLPIIISVFNCKQYGALSRMIHS